jgi:hypothetical protein
MSSEGRNSTLTGDGTCGGIGGPASGRAPRLAEQIIIPARDSAQ